METPTVRKMYHELNAEEREAYHAHVREEARKCGVPSDDATAKELSAFYDRPNQNSGD